MERPTIHCPHCGRELYHLHNPHCSWCGADLPEQEFEKVALPLGELPTPDLPPLQADNAWMQPQSSNGWGLFNQNSTYQQQKYQIDLNITQVVLFVCLLLIPAAYFFWQNWQRHQVAPPVHQSISQMHHLR